MPTTLKASHKKAGLGAVVRLKSGGPKMTVIELFKTEQGVKMVNLYHFRNNGELLMMEVPRKAVQSADICPTI